MDVKLNATTDLHAAQIKLDWTWFGQDSRPDFRLLRRQLDYPIHFEDGFSVIGLRELFSPNDIPWGQIICRRYVIANSLTEGGLIQAEIKFYFSAVGDAQPHSATIRILDSTQNKMVEMRIDGLSRVIENHCLPAVPWHTVETIDVYSAPGGGAEQCVGRIVNCSDHSNITTAAVLTWTPLSGTPFTVDYDFMEVQETLTESLPSPTNVRRLFVLRRNGKQTILKANVEEYIETQSREARGTISVTDCGLSAEVAYCYRLFSTESKVPASWQSGLTMQTSALSGRDYRQGRRLYQLLPEVHRRYDEPGSTDFGKGQLRRFMQVFGSGLDQFRSLTEGLRTRHDLDNVPVAQILPLARLIGWETDQTLDTQTQRNDIRHAPKLFGTTGTIPNLRSLVNRVTGWDCRVKEFVNNVFLTNAPESVQAWEIYSQVITGADGDTPVLVTQTEGIDGRPAGALFADQLWIAFHSDRSGRREIWFERMTGPTSLLRRAMQGTPDDAQSLSYIDESPAIVTYDNALHLFWASNRSGTWDVWTRSYKPMPGGLGLMSKDMPKRLTFRDGEQRCPAVVVHAGRIWLFWQSARRDTSEVWQQRFDGTTWDDPLLLVSNNCRNLMPTATSDGNNKLWLFWMVDQSDRTNIKLKVLDGSEWGKETWITNDSNRNEAPTAIRDNDKTLLFWHSLIKRRWEILMSTYEGIEWSNPKSVVASSANEKEPAVVVDTDNKLRIFWRSQRRVIQHRSRTVDTKDAQLMANLKQRSFEDRAHYIYDVGKKDHDWYARDCVGVFLKPNCDPADFDQKVQHLRDFVEPFRPLTVRFVWITNS